MIFLCTGLGGGTGSGASPLIAHLARSTGALVIAFATMPFAFEGKGGASRPPNRSRNSRITPIS